MDTTDRMAYLRLLSENCVLYRLHLVGSIRAGTHTGRPLGSHDFVVSLERQLHRNLAPRPGGRPPKQRPDAAQLGLDF